MISAVLAVSRALASAPPRESLQMQPNLLLQVRSASVLR